MSGMCSIEHSGASFSARAAGPTHRKRINPWGMFRGAFVPNWLLRRPEVSSGAKLCYGRLCQFSGEANKCHPKQETLAAELGVSVRTVNDYLRELRLHGLLEWKQLGFGRANRYSFLDHEWIHQGPPLRVSSSSNTQNSSVQQRQLSAAPVVEENQGRESKERSTQTSVSPSYSLPSSEEEAVESAASVGVPPAFARTEFNRLEGVDWIDGCGRPVRKWSAYLKYRWTMERSQRAGGAASTRGKRRSAPGSSLKTVSPDQFTGAVGKL